MTTSTTRASASFQDTSSSLEIPPAPIVLSSFSSALRRRDWTTGLWALWDCGGHSSLSVIRAFDKELEGVEGELEEVWSLVGIQS